MPRNHNRRIAVRAAATIAVLASLTSHAARAQENTEHPCETRGRSVIIIDDSVNVSASIAEQAKTFQLPPPAQVMQSLDAWRKCLTMLDNDPLFWMLPGAAQPDFVLRVRISELKAVERSLGEKANSAVGRYIGSYIGQTQEEVPALKSAEAAVDVLCPKTRRKVATFTGRSNEVELPRAEQNTERLQQALENAAREVAALLSATSSPCQPAPNPPAK